jgi:hypothetical protein
MKSGIARTTATNLQYPASSLLMHHRTEVKGWAERG